MRFEYSSRIGVEIDQEGDSLYAVCVISTTIRVNLDTDSDRIAFRRAKQYKSIRMYRSNRGM